MQNFLIKLNKGDRGQYVVVVAENAQAAKVQAMRWANSKGPAALGFDSFSGMSIEDATGMPDAQKYIEALYKGGLWTQDEAADVKATDPNLGGGSYNPNPGVGGTGTNSTRPPMPTTPARPGFTWEWDDSFGQWVEKSAPVLDTGLGGTIGGRDESQRQAFNSNYLAAAPGSASPFDRFYRKQQGSAGDIFDLQTALGLTGGADSATYLNNLSGASGGIAGSIARTAGNAWDALMDQFRDPTKRVAPAEGLGLYDANPEAETFNLAASVARDAARRKYGARGASFLRDPEDVRQRYLAQEPGAQGTLGEYLNFISRQYGF